MILWWYLRKLKSQNQDVRRQAAKKLGKLGDKRALKSLVAALNDFDKEVILDVIEALEKIGDAGAVKPIAKMLKYDDLSWVAARCLGRLVSQAVEPLIESLKEGNLADIAIIQSLGQIGDIRALEHILNACDRNRKMYEKNSSLIIGIVERLSFKQGQIKAAQYARSIRELIEHKEEIRVIELIKEITIKDYRVGFQEELGLISELSKYNDPWVLKFLAIVFLHASVNDQSQILKIFKEKRKIPAEIILPAMTGSYETRELAIDVIGKFGDRQAVDLILGLLDDKDYFIRLGAIKTLGALGDPIAIEPLRIAAQNDKGHFYSPDGDGGTTLYEIREAVKVALSKINAIASGKVIKLK